MLPFERPLFTPPVQMELLKQHILDCLEKQQSVTLAQIVEAYPTRLGLAELVTYLVIAKGEWNAVIDTETRDPILWKDKMGKERCANLVRVVYTYDNIKTRIGDINQPLSELQRLEYALEASVYYRK